MPSLALVHVVSQPRPSLRVGVFCRSNRRTLQREQPS
jgi:hypothetical protein